jgi:hypothetical protein
MKILDYQIKFCPSEQLSILVAQIFPAAPTNFLIQLTELIKVWQKERFWMNVDDPVNKRQLQLRPNKEPVFQDVQITDGKFYVRAQYNLVSECAGICLARKGWKHSNHGLDSYKMQAARSFGRSRPSPYVRVDKYTRAAMGKMTYCPYCSFADEPGHFCWCASQCHPPSGGCGMMVDKEDWLVAAKPKKRRRQSKQKSLA